MRFKDEKLTNENSSPLFQISKMQSRIYDVDISRIKATLPVENGYCVPYHREVCTAGEIVYMLHGLSALAGV